MGINETVFWKSIVAIYCRRQDKLRTIILDVIVIRRKEDINKKIPTGCRGWGISN